MPEAIRCLFSTSLGSLAAGLSYNSPADHAGPWGPSWPIIWGSAMNSDADTEL